MHPGIKRLISRGLGVGVWAVQISGEGVVKVLFFDDDLDGGIVAPMSAS